MEYALNQDVTGMARLIQIVIFIAAAALILAAFLGVLYIIYCLLRRYSFENLEYKRYFSEKGAFEEQEIYLIEEFANHSILPMFRVDVETHITSKLYMPGVSGGREINDKTEPYQEFISRFFIMPYTKIRRKHKVICQKRGHYQLESAKIRFMKIELYLDSKAELKVYPKELKIEDINRINNCIQTSAVSRKPILRDPFTFARVREYGPGDAMNTINHKATARAGRLMVNEKEFVLGRRLIVYLNFQAGDTGIHAEDFVEIMEKAMEYVAYIAGEALREGWQIGYRANCRMADGGHFVRIDTGTGYGKYIEILDSLAGAAAVFGNSISYVLNKDVEEFVSGTEIFIFTTYLDGSIQSKIEAFENMGNAVYVINLKEVTAYEA